jgi:hypothetical protein
MQKQNLFLLLIFAFFTLAFSSCSSEDNNGEVQPELEVQTVKNIAAPGDLMNRETGEILEERPFVRFSLESGQVVGENDAWDIAFKGTTLAVNGGSFSGDGLERSGEAAGAFADGIFEEFKEVPASLNFVQDSETQYAIPRGSDNGWYSYSPMTHTISPIPGRVLFFKSNNGNYVKLEVLSYYKDMPETPDRSSESAHYSFRYVIQTDGSRNF